MIFKFGSVFSGNWGSNEHKKHDLVIFYIIPNLLKYEAEPTTLYVKNMHFKVVENKKARIPGLLKY